LLLWSQLSVLSWHKVANTLKLLIFLTVKELCRK
jgi:hypothetical protein